LEKGSKSADAKAALQDIQERHQEIIKIEQTVMVYKYIKRYFES